MTISWSRTNDGKYWDFRGVSASYLVHGMHPYPARMHPHIARTLIARFGKSRSGIVDPFCGSGTTLVESLLAGFDSYGIDLNPLALIVSKAKTTLVDPDDVSDLVLQSTRLIKRSKTHFAVTPTGDQSKILKFWFKRRVLSQLLALKEELQSSELWHSRYKWLFASCLSRTARAVSNQRPYEFKAYRLPKELRQKHNPHVPKVFEGIVLQSISRQLEFYLEFQRQNRDRNPSSEVLLADSRTSYFRAVADLVITSPPYGDSPTTVNYEQFSRISLMILDIPRRDFGWTRERHQKVAHESVATDSLTRRVMAKLGVVDAHKARVLGRNFDSLWRSISSMTQLLKGGGVCCVVLGPRTVRGVTIPTPDIVSEYADQFSLKRLDCISRNIPRKVQPWRNNSGRTIDNEKILIFSKLR